MKKTTSSILFVVVFCVPCALSVASTNRSRAQSHVANLSDELFRDRCTMLENILKKEQGVRDRQQKEIDRLKEQAHAAQLRDAQEIAPLMEPVVTKFAELKKQADTVMQRAQSAWQMAENEKQALEVIIASRDERYDELAAQNQAYSIKAQQDLQALAQLEELKRTLAEKKAHIAKLEKQLRRRDPGAKRAKKKPKH